MFFFALNLKSYYLIYKNILILIVFILLLLKFIIIKTLKQMLQNLLTIQKCETRDPDITS